MKQSFLIATAALFPLVCTVISFQIDSRYAFEWAVGGVAIGWVAAGFIHLPWLWLKVLFLLVYPIAMCVASWFAMLVTHGIRGGPF